MNKAAYQMVGYNFNNDRIENDFYATPIDAIEDLIKYEKFDGKIWECSCGDGAISDPLIKAGYDVYSSDLIDRGYGEVKDFLTTNEKVDNIITNPPFNLATEFTLKAFELAKYKVVMLSKISYLEGVKRRELIFNKNKLERVLIFTRRVPFKKESTQKLAGGLMAFGWFIYDVNYNGKPQIDWI
jgi:hypothetical protein